MRAELSALACATQLPNLNLVAFGDSELGAHLVLEPFSRRNKVNLLRDVSTAIQMLP